MLTKRAKRSRAPFPCPQITEKTHREPEFGSAVTEFRSLTDPVGVLCHAVALDGLDICIALFCAELPTSFVGIQINSSLRRSTSGSSDLGRGRGVQKSKRPKIHFEHSNNLSQNVPSGDVSFSARGNLDVADPMRPPKYAFSKAFTQLRFGAKKTYIRKSPLAQISRI